MKQKEQIQRYRALLQLLGLTIRLNPGWSIAIALLTLVLGLLPAAQVIVLRTLVNAVGSLAASGGLPPEEMAWWLGGLVLFFTVPNLVYSLLPILQGGYREANSHALRLAVLQRVANLELLTHEEPGMRDQLHRVDRALAVSIQPWSESILWFFQALVMVAAMSVVLIEAHWSICLLAILGGLLHLRTEAAIQRNQYNLFAAQTPTQRWEQYLTSLLTTIQPRRDVLVFGAAPGILRRWREVVAELRQEQWSLQRQSAWRSLGGKLLFLLVYLLPLGILMARQVAGAIDIGLLAGVFSALSGFYAGLSLLVMTTSGWVGQGMYAADLIDFLKRPALDKAPPMADHPTVRTGAAIRCQQVCFTYPESKSAALTEVDLNIAPGEWVAVVGANGSGKSTLMRLLLGLYRPTAGEVSLTDSGRSAVLQEFGRYSLRLRENLGFGHLPYLAADGELERVRQQVGLELPGVATSAPLEQELGREFGGIELSGGNWQRVALGRGQLAPAGLVILDEATSALDPEAEDQLLRGLRQHLDGATVLFVAHRLPVARLADRIILLEEGRIVEEGSHEALLRLNGRYAELYRAQAQWYQAAVG